MKTVLFGGSFDPATKSHVEIIGKLCDRFDRTVVVPCRISPFKSAVSAPSEDRINMLKLALPPKAEISRFEIESSGPSYSFVTINHFYGEDHALYFAIGSEMLASLDKWKNVRSVCDKVIFYVIPREGYPVDVRTVHALKTNGFRIEIADFEGGSGSSSEVKITVAMGKPETYLCAPVADYISARNLYLDFNYVNDLYKKYHMKEKRIKHSFSTALCGVKLAKRLDLDTNQAATALLLHDIGKYVTKEEAESMGVKFSPELNDMPLPVRHAEIGAEILAQLEKIKDNEIINAVRYHTTGRPAMTPLEKIVYLADYIEPRRDFPGVDKIRDAARVSIDEGVYAGLKNAVQYVKEEEIYPVTVAAYEYYKEILNR